MTDEQHRGEPSQDAETGIDHNLANRLGDLAREFATRHDPASTLASIVHAAVSDIPGTEHASASVVRRGRGETVDATSDLARQVDDYQYRSGQGPCLDTLFEHVTVRVDDLGAETRWPRFTTAAIDSGIHSMLSLQLFVDGGDLGALNLFSGRTGAFTDQSEEVGLAFAAHAAVAVLAAREIASLQVAVSSRDLIGQAKGMLMERHRVTADVAFSVLVRYSRDNNIKLVDIARNVVIHHGVRPS